MISKKFGNFDGAFIDEAVSAWTTNFLDRPGGRELNSHLQPGDHVICYSIDRMCRSMLDFCKLMKHFEEKKVHVHFIVDQINTATAAGKLQAHIRAAMAQFASDLISERMREAFAIKRIRNGEKVNSKPKAQWVASEWTCDPKEATQRERGRVLIYERVSSIGQYTSGLGLENQSASNNRYGERLIKEGSTSTEVFREDAISAFKVPFPKRPEGKRLMESVRAGDDVVVYRSDRAWRHPGDAVEMCEELKKKGAYLHLVAEGIRTDVGTGSDWITVLASIAHLESTLKSRRNRESADARRKQGRPCGPPRIGLKTAKCGDKKKLALDMQVVIKCAAIEILFYEFKLSRYKLIDVLTAWDCEKRKAKATIREYFNPRYVTDYLNVNCKTVREMVTEDIWEKARTAAYEKIYTPIDKRYWIVPTWEWFGNRNEYKERHSVA